MDHRQMCVSNLRYKRPTADEGKRMKQLLGYLTYRDSRDQGAKMFAGQERWGDHGMGGSVAEIAQRCDDLRSQHVLTFSLVVNPNPQLVAMIPHEQREQFVRELTERTVDGFFEARGLDTGCEYSYVLHHRESDDLQAPGMHNPHTHVVLPGTVWSEEHGERINLYFSQSKKVDHIELLHEVTEHHMADMLDRYVGLDWEQRYDALETLREEQKQIAQAEPHGYHISEDGLQIPFWGGVRQVDEQNCAVGYYMPFADEEGEVSIQFRPVAAGLDRHYAERLSAVVAGRLHQYPDDHLRLYQGTIRVLLEEGHEDIEPPTIGHSFDIDL
jgi:predicted DNA-binding protein